MWEGQDRGEFFRTINKEKYAHIKNSFENIEDIKGYNLNIMDQEMPNVEKRFDMETEKGRITKSKKYSMKYIITGACVISILFVFK